MTSNDTMNRDAVNQEALNTLTPREKKVLEMRFALNGEEARTLKAVGERFHVTKERIRQIEAKALRKYRSLCIKLRGDPE